MISINIFQLPATTLTLCCHTPPTPWALSTPRDTNDDTELRFGVVDEVLYGTKTPPVPGAQWTGVVTSIALKMLESGAVDAVVCVQSDPDDR